MKQIMFMGILALSFSSFAANRSGQTIIIRSCEEALTPDSAYVWIDDSEDIAVQTSYYSLIRLNDINVSMDLRIALSTDLLERLSAAHKLRSTGKKLKAIDAVIDRGATIEVRIGDNLHIVIKGADVKVDLTTGRLVEIAWTSANLNDHLTLTGLNTIGKENRAKIDLKFTEIEYRLAGAQTTGIEVVSHAISPGPSQSDD